MRETTNGFSDSSAYFPGTRYGYMWWEFPPEFGIRGEINHLGIYTSYAALGAYGQVILVFPEAEMVHVHIVDSYKGKTVPLEQIMKLIDRILAAKKIETEDLIIQVNIEIKNRPIDRQHVFTKEKNEY